MTLQGFVDDIELLKMGLNLKDITVLGHSWGGLLAMHYAIKYPGHLNALILSSPIPASSEEWQQEENELAQRVTPEDGTLRSQIFQSGEMQADPSSAIRKLMLLSFKTQFYNPDLLYSLSLTIPEDFMQRSQAFQHLGPDLTSFDLYPALESLQIQTLIIYGDYEPAADLSGKHLARAIPQAKYVRISHSGHFPFVEQKASYFDTIRGFLDDID